MMENGGEKKILAEQDVKTYLSEHKIDMFIHKLEGMDLIILE